MMSNHKTSILLIGFAALLFGCSIVDTFFEPTSIPLTDTLIPTETPVPSATPTSEPAVIITRERTAEGGGFSYPGLEDWVVDEIHGELTYFESGSELWIEVFVRYDLETYPIDVFIESMIDSTDEYFDTAEIGDPYDFSLDGYEGLAFDYIGEADDDRLVGKTILILYGENLLFYVDIYAYDVGGTNILEEDGYEMVDMILDAIDLHEVRFEESITQCEVSKEEDYGTSKDNPIFMGGGRLFGFARTQYYFDSMMSPQGQRVRYSWLETIDYAGSYLDMYEVWYPGLDEDITLYVNENRWKGVMAPLGLRCMEPFPFGEP